MGDLRCKMGTGRVKGKGKAVVTVVVSVAFFAVLAWWARPLYATIFLGERDERLAVAARPVPQHNHADHLSSGRIHARGLGAGGQWGELLGSRAAWREAAGVHHPPLKSSSRKAGFHAFYHHAKKKRQKPQQEEEGEEGVEAIKGEEPPLVEGHVPEDDGCSALLVATNSTLLNAQVHRLKVAPERFEFLHIGKAGGGTIKERYEQWWKLGLSRIHPRPNPKVFKADAETFLALSLRDPVDRFVSGFYWRIFLMKQCEEGQQGNSNAKSTEDHCRLHVQKDEYNVLFTVHKQNVNSLAERLCTDHRDYEDATQHVLKIGHLRSSIQDWLGKNAWKKKANLITPIVLEPGFNMMSQIDDAMQWLNTKLNFEADPQAWAARETHVQLKDCEVKVKEAKELATQATPSDSDSDSTSDSDSRSKQYDSTHSSAGLSTRVPLSAAGERCLLQYYEADYATLRALRDTACKTRECKRAVKAMLQRRDLW